MASLGIQVAGEDAQLMPMWEFGRLLGASNTLLFVIKYRPASCIVWRKDAKYVAFSEYVEDFGIEQMRCASTLVSIWSSSIYCLESSLLRRDVYPMGKHLCFLTSEGLKDALICKGWSQIYWNVNKSLLTPRCSWPTP